MDKERMIYVHNTILLRTVERGNSVICDNMDGNGGLCEIRQAQKDK
jgi:hypothetical protein